MQTLTKRQVREALGFTTDTEVAEFFGVSISAVSQWGGDDSPIPEKRLLQLLRRRPDLFGLRPVGQPAAHNGPDGGSAA